MMKNPFIRSSLTTKRIMLEFFISLLIVWFFSVLINFSLNINNGIYSIINPLLCIIFAILIDFVFLFKKKTKIKKLINDIINSYSYISGLLLGLILPVGCKVYTLFIATLVSIVLGKYIFGKTGQNIFNPCLLGRIFVQSAFSNELNYSIDVATSATLLEEFSNSNWSLGTFQQNNYSLLDIFIGRYYGTIGETSSLIIIIVGLILIFRKVIDYRLPLFFIITFYLSTLTMGICSNHGITSFKYALYHLLSGGVLFGCFFCLTDPVTTPTSNIGKILFAISTSLITFIIRYFSSLTEGFAYGLLIMNCFTYLIDYYFRGVTNKIHILKLATVGLIFLINLSLGFYLGISKLDRYQNKSNITLHIQKTHYLNMEKTKISKYSLIDTLNKFKQENNYQERNYSGYESI